MTVKTNAGAIDALANYWVTRLTYALRREETALPEFNLPDAASEAMMAWSKTRGFDAEQSNLVSCAFQAGIEFATILHSRPLDAEPELSSVLEQLTRLAKD